MKIIEHDAATGEVIEREMTSEEIAQWEADKAKAEAMKIAQATKAHERSALLAKLGITEEEAALLLGGN